MPPSNLLLSQAGGISSLWVTENYPAGCEWVEFERVVDGDTLIVEGDGRVRLVGIDTPESKREGTPIQAYSLEATAALKALLAGQTEICLIADGVGDQYDTYGRRLSYGFTREGVDLNAKMIADGWAKAYTRFPMERADEFTALEKTARQEKLGRWEN